MYKDFVAITVGFGMIYPENFGGCVRQELRADKMSSETKSELIRYAIR
jgi:hypothetical protein